MTSDEKWLFWIHVKWKRLWGKQNESPPTISKAGLHPKKVMSCIWWVWKGVLYYELLPENQTINSNNAPNALQLDQVKAAPDKRCLELVNRKQIIFHPDTARPRVSLMTRQKLLTAWLGSSDSSAVFTRHSTFRCPCISVFTKFP